MLLDTDDNGNILLELKFCYENKEFNILEKNYETYVVENKFEVLATDRFKNKQIRQPKISKESGHKILLFSSYTSMFKIIEKELEKKEIKYFKLVGNTPVNKRIEMVDEFNNNEDIKVFLISPKAGGTGLNLTSADVVIHYDPWWNVSSENQATDRAYRIGQKNSVQVYKLITSNSIEEKINKMQERKEKLSKDVLSTEETFISKMTKEEILDLFE